MLYTFLKKNELFYFMLKFSRDQFFKPKLKSKHIIIMPLLSVWVI